jgi:hypothetical protein
MTWKNFICTSFNINELVLIDDRYISQAPLLELPELSEFKVYSNKPHNGAFWNPEETEVLDQIEDDLIRLW